MTREESQRALLELAASPAAKWIGNRVIDSGKQLLQKCMRCGAEELLELPSAAVPNAAARVFPDQIPLYFDEKLYAWKRKFQSAHESCSERGAAT